MSGNHDDDAVPRFFHKGLSIGDVVYRGTPSMIRSQLDARIPAEARAWRGPEGLTPIMDLGPAMWIVETLRPWDVHTGLRVGSIVPPVFEAYARILHPGTRWRENEADPTDELVRWSEVAAWSRREITPSIGFHELGTRADGSTWTRAAEPPLRHGGPVEGELTREEATTLARLLEPFTASDRWWFALWDGWGYDELRAFRFPRLNPAHRTYFVFTGPPEGIAAFELGSIAYYQSPALWWPDDRSWCVATEIDFWCTYVGGTRDAIEAILADGRFEALEVSADDPSETAGPGADED